MRFLAVLLFALSAHAADFPTFMTGSWRMTMPNGTTVEEHWTTADGGLMLGVGRTVPKSGKTDFELLRIEKVDGKLTYLAMPHAAQATPFTMKSLTDSRVVFENLEHDFPQRIIYWRDGQRLCARVESKSGEGEEWCWSKYAR